MTELHGDIAQAEGLLLDLATELRRAPIQATLRLQLRALQLKRLVTSWAERCPDCADEASRRAVLDELLAMQCELESHLLRSRSDEEMEQAGWAFARMASR
jgi:hypothetical protein